MSESEMEIDTKELQSKADIKEYIEQYTTFIEKNGAYWCCSPLNQNDINPSLCVDEDKQIFYCFSTHQGGDLLTFIMLYNKVGFRQAIDILLKYLKIDNLSQVNTQLPQNISSLKYCKQYQQKKKKEADITSEILDKDTMIKYEEDWDKLSLWTDEGMSKEVLQQYQVRYDRQDDRIVFPIFDYNGNIINVSGRTLNPDYKEKKIRKYTYYYKMGRLDAIYNLYQRKQEILSAKSVIVFEGVKSVLLCETYGIKNSVAVFTCTINDDQLRQFIKLGVNVIFAFDTDKNIFKDKKIQILKHYVNVDYIYNFNNLLGEKDSPIDKGLNTFKILYDKRKVIF